MDNSRRNFLRRASILGAAGMVAAGSKANPPKAGQVPIPGPGRADLKISPIRS